MLKFKLGCYTYPFPRRNLEDNDVQRGAIVKGINSRRLQKTWGERRTRGGEKMGQAGRPGPIEPAGPGLFQSFSASPST